MVRRMCAIVLEGLRRVRQNSQFSGWHARDSNPRAEHSVGGPKSSPLDSVTFLRATPERDDVTREQVTAVLDNAAASPLCYCAYSDSSERITSAFFHASANCCCTAPASSERPCLSSAWDSPNRERPLPGLDRRSSRNVRSASAARPLSKSAAPSDSRSGWNHGRTASRRVKRSCAATAWLSCIGQRAHRSDRVHAWNRRGLTFVP